MDEPMAKAEKTTSNSSTLTLPETLITAARRSQFRKSIRARRSPKIHVAAGQPAEDLKKPRQRQQTQTANNPPVSPTLPERQVIRIPLDFTQLERLQPILDASRKANRFEGILCTLSRAYSPAAGVTVLELQLLEVDRRTTAALRKITR
jgi:hypothetical protein